MVKPEVKKIIRQLKKRKITVFEVPQEYESDIQLVLFERESGLRITGKRGFDIISNSFFIEEDLVHVDIDDREQRESVYLSFDNFESYFEFLHGDIYDNACYTFCHLSEDIIASREIDIKRLMKQRAFIEKTIDDYTLSVSDEERENYENAKQIHRQCQRWVKKFNKCNSYDELIKVVEHYRKSKIHSVVDVSFFFFQYIFFDVEDKHRFEIIMEYMSTGAYPQYKIINELCSIYNPDDVVQKFNYSSGAKGTQYKHKRRLKEYVRCLKDEKIEFELKTYFDETTHYYCVEAQGYEKGCKFTPISKIYRYFESFEEFIVYCNGDLTHCDLSAALECNVDFSKYIIDETTKLPSQANMETICSVKKYYDKEMFYVIKQWRNTFGSIVKESRHSFRYFFDFVAFLKNDLSDADLVFCDGLLYLKKWNSVNFANAKMRSALCEKFNVKYDKYEIETKFIESFKNVEQNENETALFLQASRDLTLEATERNLSTFDILIDSKCQKVCYISDIHLLHRLQIAGCRSKEDVIYVIQKIVNTIASEAGSLLLIDGDVSSDFKLFQLFVKMLSLALRRNTMVVFTLGNHELWSFPDLSIDKIVLKYRTFLDEYGMYLLHNDILYKEHKRPFDDSNVGTQILKYDVLCKMDNTQIFECLRSARYVIFGGLGFSGYNKEFNADNGIYRSTLDRKGEILETKKFEELYDKLRCILADKNSIILTHTPKKDWSSISGYDKKLVYVSGHTHRNDFHDDGEYRVYADNQVGYHSLKLHLKAFLIDNDYDYFADYDDGIFEITGEQYEDFCLGKNISMTFRREVNILYMLKKNGYYCFIHKSKWGNLTILNGGAMKTLESPDIQYYYDNMDIMISTIKKPLDKFTAFQNHIADIVKQIGGVGTIHGSIIDIDYYDHIYVNPIDLSVTGYYADDIINKRVYPSVPALLEENCPVIFEEYVRLLKAGTENPFALKEQADNTLSPRVYLDTDIYKASREIKKMQKLSSNILCSWYEDVLCQKRRIGS